MKLLSALMFIGSIGLMSPPETLRTGQTVIDSGKCGMAVVTTVTHENHRFAVVMGYNSVGICEVTDKSLTTLK